MASLEKPPPGAGGGKEEGDNAKPTLKKRTSNVSPKKKVATPQKKPQKGASDGKAKKKATKSKQAPPSQATGQRTRYAADLSMLEGFLSDENDAEKEPLAEQEEVEFPAEIEHQEATADPKPNQKEPEGDSDGYEFQEEDFDNLDPKDYGIEFDEEEDIYDPPLRDDNLPDLYRLMDALESGQTDLDGSDEPPSLFTRPEMVPSYKKISELKLEMEEEDIDPYVEDFEDGAKDDVLMIGSIALEDVQTEERRLRDEHITYQEQEAAVSRRRHQEVALREEIAKRKIAHDLKEKRKEIKKREELLAQKERLMMDRMHKAFRRAQNQLSSTLNDRKGEVKTTFGDLTISDGFYGGSKGRRWKVDWDKTPQPVQIKLKTLRGIKDKIPGGRYILMTSLYNRLGGHVTRWSNLKGQQWGGTTLPLMHDGKFYNSEIKLDQSVFTVLPSKPGIRPGMVLIFELFLMRGAVIATDRVVAWGAFPIADAKFDVVEGKFKCPFLRGEVDPLIENHSTIEHLMSDDMDHWLANLYFDIIKLPRYLKDQKEYEVELQFSSGILNYPDRFNTGGEEYRDGEAPIPGSLPSLRDTDTDPHNDSGRIDSLDSSSNLNQSLDGSSSDVRKPPLAADITDDIKIRPPSSHTTRSSTASLGKRSSRSAGGLQKKVQLGADSDSDEYEEEDLEAIKKSRGFFPIKGKPGIFYQQFKTNVVDEYHKKIYALLPKTSVLTKRQRRKRLTYQEELEEHNYSVRDPDSDKGHTTSEGSEKMQYIARQLMAEIGLSQWRSKEFWTMLFMLAFVFFIRMFVHYCGQWIFLQGMKLPINKFTFYPYTVTLNYQPTLLTMAEETMVVMMGPLANVFVCALFVFICWIVQMTLGQFPDIGCKFVIALCIMTVMDPFLTCGVDCLLERWKDVGGDVPIGDFVKLYWHFERAQGSGIAGIMVTLFIYMFTCFAAGAILYMYFLRLHNNGRMLDVFWRLHGDEDMFFVPYDLEMSNQELAYLVKKAEQWRGEEGERRKVAVYDYIWEEEPTEEVIWDENGDEVRETKEGKQEITTHVSVHTVHLDGLRELYRHFLRMPEGAIVEVFGDMALPGMDKDMQSALAEGSSGVEKTEPTKPKVRGRETAVTTAGFHLEDEDDKTGAKKMASLDKKNE